MAPIFDGPSNIPLKPPKPGLYICISLHILTFQVPTGKFTNL